MISKFIAVEGLDGSGKTTVISKIVKYLHNHGIINVITTHEPGGTPVSNFLRNLIKKSIAGEPIQDISELLMLYAARVQLLENVIKPALIKGYWVVSDRYVLSTEAYQGGGRKIDKLLLNILFKKAINGFVPDLTFYLDVCPKISFSRIKNRSLLLDRIENEPLIFFNRVRKRYQEIANSNRRIVTIDANRSLSNVIFSIFKILDKWFLEN